VADPAYQRAKSQRHRVEHPFGLAKQKHGFDRAFRGDDRAKSDFSASTGRLQTHQIGERSPSILHSPTN